MKRRIGLWSVQSRAWSGAEQAVRLARATLPAQPGAHRTPALILMATEQNSTMHLAARNAQRAAPHTLQALLLLLPPALSLRPSAMSTHLGSSIPSDEGNPEDALSVYNQEAGGPCGIVCRPDF